MTTITNPLSSLALDKDGFLLNQKDWNKDIALAIAAQEKIILSKEHWEIIEWVQRYFEAYELSPEMRPLIKYLKLHLNSAVNSIYLLSLFPDSPAKLASKIAGLPKPDNCL